MANSKNYHPEKNYIHDPLTGAVTPEVKQFIQELTSMLQSTVICDWTIIDGQKDTMVNCFLKAHWLIFSVTNGRIGDFMTSCDIHAGLVMKVLIDTMRSASSPQNIQITKLSIKGLVGT